MASAKWFARYARRDQEWRVIERPRRLVATCPDEWAAQRLVTLHATAQAVLDVLVPECEHIGFELLWAFARALGDDRAFGPDYELRLLAPWRRETTTDTEPRDEIGGTSGVAAEIDDLDGLIAERTARDPAYPKILAAGVRHRRLVDQLVALRKASRISRAALARATHVDLGGVADIEAGRATVPLAAVERYVAAASRHTLRLGLVEVGE